MDDEGQDNHEENLERPDTVAIIFSHHTREPDVEEEECNPDDHGFTENLDKTSEFGSYESSCPGEELGIQLEKVL